jgi:nucleotide-binding universal stress UspA family protein
MSPTMTNSSLLYPRNSTTTSGVTSPGYTKGVSFDTFETPIEASMFSFTLKVKSEGYKRSRSTRVFLCAASKEESGAQALEWAVESLVQDGDELIVVRGFDSDEMQKETYESVREEAKALMRQITDKNSEFPDRRLSVVVEFVAGKIIDTIERLIALYRPDSLIVGTRGPRGRMATWGAALRAPGMGSVSRYCVSHSPVPVIVVQPERRVRKTLEKRRNDPNRHMLFEEFARPQTRDSTAIA